MLPEALSEAAPAEIAGRAASPAVALIVTAPPLDRVPPELVTDGAVIAIEDPNTVPLVFTVPVELIETLLPATATADPGLADVAPPPVTVMNGVAVKVG